MDEWARNKLKESGSCPPLEKEYFRKDGTRLPVLVGVVFHEAPEQHLVCLVIDASDRRKAMEAVRTRWVSGVPSEFTDPKICSSFYDHSYQNLKEYIGYYLDTPTMGLTAEEMRKEMQRLGAQPDLTLKVARVLEACETLRYTRDGVSANTEAASAVAQDMREILIAKR